MKMVRSLLLGSAAGFVAVAGAQAADLPVKAKPVAYVKICDLYGAGYFYVPGTDTCLKIGGYVRVNANYNNQSGFVYAGTGSNGGGFAALFNDRDTSNISFRARSWITADARSQTAWGTLRSYYALQFTNVGPSGGDTATATSMVRAFIQIAGFTVGRATSAFDTPDANGALVNNIAGPFGGTTGPTGINVFQYTAQFGNGLSLTGGIESVDQRRRPVANLSSVSTGSSVGFSGVAGAGGSGVVISAPGSNGLTVTPAGTAGNVFNLTGPTPNLGTISSHEGSSGGGGGDIPDFAVNLDLTQAWGSARVVGALHRVAGGYYAANTATSLASGCGGGGAAATFGNSQTSICGGPSSKLGFGVGAGFTLTALPGLPGSLIGASVGYSEGAAGYTQGLAQMNLQRSGKVAWGIGTEAVYANPGQIAGYGGDIQLTRNFYVSAAFQYAWAPNLKTSIYGGYSRTTYNGTATALICSGGTAGGFTTPLGAAGPTGFRVANCDPDYSYWQIGSRIFQWTPVQNLDIGLDLVYNRFQSAFQGNVSAGTTSGQPGAATVAASTAAGLIRRADDIGVGSVVVEVRRSFWP